MSLDACANFNEFLAVMTELRVVQHFESKHLKKRDNKST